MCVGFHTVEEFVTDVQLFDKRIGHNRLDVQRFDCALNRICISPKSFMAPELMSEHSKVLKAHFFDSMQIAQSIFAIIFFSPFVSSPFICVETERLFLF